MGYLTFLFIALVIGVGCGYVLYRAAERVDHSPWVWGAIGFLTNVVGLLVFRLTVGPIVKY